MTNPMRALAGAATAAAALALPAIATANVHVACEAGTPVVHLTGWGIPANLVDVTVTADGQILRSGPLTIAAAADETIAFPTATTAAVTATARRTPTSALYTSGAPVTCTTTAPAPTPATAPQTTTPGPSQVEPTPAKRPTVVRRPAKRSKPITCQDLKARGAGRGWYVRFGINYWRCHTPKGVPFGPDRPFRGVTG